MRLINALVTLILMVVSTADAVSSTIPEKNNPESLYLNWRDASVLPSDDFFNYANGTWQKLNPIPPEYARWGNFNILQEKVQAIIHTMLIDAANKKKRHLEVLYKK